MAAARMYMPTQCVFVSKDLASKAAMCRAGCKVDQDE